MILPHFRTNDNIQKKSNKINKSMNKTINISDKYGKGNCTEWNNQWTVSGNHESLFKRAEHNKTKSKNAREDGPHEDTEWLVNIKFIVHNYYFSFLTIITELM